MSKREIRILNLSYSIHINPFTKGGQGEQAYLGATEQLEPQPTPHLGVLKTPPLLTARHVQHKKSPWPKEFIN